MLTPHVIFNVTRKLVPSNSDICIGHNPSKCNNSDLRCASSDIDDHISHRLLYIDADANCCGHRLMNEIDILASCMLCRILYSTFLYVCDPRRNAYDHSVRGCKPRFFILIDHFNHPFNHLLSRLKIGNDPIPQWSYRFDVFMRLSMHLLCKATYSDYASSFNVLRYYGRLVNDDLVLVVNDCICSSQINGDILHEKVKQAHNQIYTFTHAKPI